MAVDRWRLRGENLSSLVMFSVRVGSSSTELTSEGAVSPRKLIFPRIFWLYCFHFLLAWQLSSLVYFTFRIMWSVLCKFPGSSLSWIGSLTKRVTFSAAAILCYFWASTVAVILILIFSNSVVGGTSLNCIFFCAFLFYSYVVLWRSSFTQETKFEHRSYSWLSFLAAPLNMLFQASSFPLNIRRKSSRCIR